MRNVKQTQLTGPDLIDYAIANTPPEELTSIEELWRGMTLPTLRETLTYPAICDSKKNTVIQTDKNGRYHEYMTMPDGESYDIDNDLIEWTVPGRGSLRHEIFMSKIISCEDDQSHYVRGTPRHCWKPTCPACAHDWAVRKASENSQIIYAHSRDARHTEGWRAGYLQHVTVSVPESMYYMALIPGGLNKLRKIAIKHAQSVGIHGGHIIFHPFRQNGVNSDDELPEDYVPASTNDGEKHTARFAPHFHILGFGFVTGTDKLFSETGWIVKTLRTGNNKITNVSQIAGVFSYLLSHAGVISETSPHTTQTKAIQPFGSCGSNAKIRVGSVAIYTPQICPECGAPLKKHSVHGANGDTSIDGDFEKKTLYPIFATRKKANDLRTFLEDYTSSPVAALRQLDTNPHMGYCSISYRQLVAMLNPMSVKCLDGSLHVIQSEAFIKLKPKRSRSDQDGPVKVHGLSSSCPDAPRSGGMGAHECPTAPATGAYGGHSVTVADSDTVQASEGRKRPVFEDYEVIDYHYPGVAYDGL